MSNEAGIYKATDYSLKSLTLISPFGQVINLSLLQYELSIVEDIFSSTMNGYLKIFDAYNLVDVLKISGNEFLYVNIEKSGLATSIEKFFRVYKVSDRTPYSDNLLTYTIHFCSEEQLLDAQYRIRKSYKDTSLSDIVVEILTDYLSVKDKKIDGTNIEKTVGYYDVIIPNLRPFQAINWMTKNTLNNQLSSCYMLFENLEGFNFKSLDYMTTQKSVKKLNMAPKAVLQNEPALIIDSINDFVIDHDFDMLSQMANGGTASKLYNLNLLEQNFETIELAANDIKSDKTLEKFKSLPDVKNRKGDRLIDATDSFVRYASSTVNTAYRYTLLQRAMQMSLLASTKIRVQVNGDPRLNAGKVIDLQFRTYQPFSQEDPTLSDRYSGRYLMTSVNHVFKNDIYFSNIELMRDSSPKKLPTSTPSETFIEAQKS